MYYGKDRNPIPRRRSAYSSPYSSSGSRARSSFPWKIVLVGVAFILAVIISIAVYRSTAKHVVFTVSDKAVASTQDGHEYQIFATNGDVYQDSDSVVFWKFNSSNVYGELRVGHTYNCLVTGWRVPLLSAKNNIISCVEVHK